MMNGPARFMAVLFFFVAASVWVLLMAGCERKAVTDPAPQGDRGTATGSGVQSGTVHSAAGFASHQKLVAHFEKHGNEFGRISMQEYLRMAQDLRDRPRGGDIREAVRQDGVITRFDRSTGAFIAFNPDGVIRTFFKPADGEAYFVRQARRQK